MLRIASVLALLVAIASPASATEASLAIGPEDTDHYYLRVNATEPEAPRAATPEDDCAHGERPATMEEGVLAVVQPFLSNPPPFTESGTTEPYVPSCVAVPLQSCLPSGACNGASGIAYASYNVTSGRYYVELERIPVAPGLTAHMNVILALTGTTGVGAEGDCKTCPPPVV